MNKTVLVIALLVVAAAGAALLWWQRQAPPPPADIAAPKAEPQIEQSAPEAPAIKYPIESVTPAEKDAASAPTPAETDQRIDAALIDLLGRDAVASFLRINNFPMRVVATVDNLARSHASPKVWPVNPAPTRFTVEGGGNEVIISNENSKRYVPFVHFIESVDLAGAVALYKKHYALFQRAYEDLGYPDAYFNDRLVAVIDHLLATPDPAGPLKVKLTEVESETERVRPWVNYRFVDSELEALSAGQKMLLRAGPDNRQRLKAKLREMRRYVTGQAAAQP